MKKMFMAVIALMMTISASAQFYIYFSDGTVAKVDSISMIAPAEPEQPEPSVGIGVFSVAEGKTVTFSKGNLQYHPANDEWRFAANQADYVDSANSNISATYNGWIDLFGWGTGNAPTKSSESYSDYQTFVDWGTNKIGDDAPNTWRTLTKDEWVYLFNTRTNASSLYGVAQVNGVNGMVVLPDNWTCPSGVTFKSGLHPEYVDDYSVYQSFTTEQWSKMEQAGAAFLPASGYRRGTDVGSVGYDGRYWSSTEYDEDIAYRVYFGSDELSPQGGLCRFDGMSVRLVKDME